MANQGLSFLKNNIPLPPAEGDPGYNCEVVNPLAIAPITTTPDGANIPLKSIINWIHGLATRIHHSPQKTQKFFQSVKLFHKGKGTIGATNLVVDVKTCWNSTYYMLQMACDLK